MLKRLRNEVAGFIHRLANRIQDHRWQCFACGKYTSEEIVSDEGPVYIAVSCPDGECESRLIAREEFYGES